MGSYNGGGAVHQLEAISGQSSMTMKIYIFLRRLRNHHQLEMTPINNKSNNKTSLEPPPYSARRS